MTTTRLATGLMLLFACSSNDGQSTKSARVADQTKPVGGAAQDSDAAAQKPIIAAPADLATLPLWFVPENANSAGEATIVHAADADLLWLAGFLAADGAAMVTTEKIGQLVTGRLEATSTAGAGAALAAAYPATANAEPSTTSGRGMNIDLRFYGAEPANVARMLADVLDANMVFAAPEAKRVSIATKRFRADAALRSIVDALGLALHREGNTYFITDAAIRPPAELLALKGPKSDLAVNGANASEVIALVDALGSVGHTTPCGEGAAITLRLRSATPGHILASVALLSQAIITKGGTDVCPVTEATQKPGSDATLVATATRGTRSLALFRAADGAGLLVGGTDSLADGTAVRVGGGFVTFGDDRSVTLYPDELGLEAGAEPYAALFALLESSRLAATIVLESVQHALIQVPTGEFHMVSSYRPNEVVVDSWAHTRQFGDGSVLSSIEDSPVHITPGVLLWMEELHPNEPPPAPKKIVLRPR